MKIEELSIHVTPFREGRTLVASSWRAVDEVDSMGRVRRIFHYDTLMGEYAEWSDFSWHLSPLSVGHGSVTDQKYMNILLKENGSPVRMWRDGGNPRYSITRDGYPVRVPF